MVGFVQETIGASCGWPCGACPGIDPKGHWQLRFMKEGKTYLVGYFADEEVTAKAYDSDIAPLAGEFAWPNFSVAA
jgi:hypothetical protein